MSEEIKKATTNVPMSMVTSIFINGLLAFGMLIAVLFYLGDFSPESQSPTGFPFIAILANGTRSNGAATTMVSIIVVLEFCSSVAALAAASRMMWSFARDHGLPGWRVLSQVSILQTMGLLFNRIRSMIVQLFQSTLYAL